MAKVEHPRKRLGVLALVGLLVVTSLPIGASAGGPVEGETRLELALEQISDLLVNLESELAALERPAAERLEERLAGAIEAIANLLGELEDEEQAPDEGTWRARVLRFDLELHRLAGALGEIVESAGGPTERRRAEASLERLRVELDSIIMDASFGMETEQFQQLEEAVYKTARLLGARIKDLAERAEPRSDAPRLARLVERLEDLLSRLDTLILHRFPLR